MLKALLAGSALALLASVPADARLQLTINVGASTFTCFDGQLSCDLSGATGNLLTIDQTVGGVFVQLTLAQSTFGKVNELQLSSSNIDNSTALARTVTLIASDTNFAPPTEFIRNSGSLTFNTNVGAPDSTLAFFADTGNLQGANPLNLPGVLLESVSGHATTDPDSFSGSRISPFFASSPYSMSESANLTLIAGGSVTGFNQAMQSGVPEPSTWALGLLGFGMLTLFGLRSRRSKPRLLTA